jgi:hypothetical protein
VVSPRGKQIHSNVFPKLEKGRITLIPVIIHGIT